MGHVDLTVYFGHEVAVLDCVIDPYYMGIQSELVKLRRDLTRCMKYERTTIGFNVTRGLLEVDTNFAPHFWKFYCNCIAPSRLPLAVGGGTSGGVLAFNPQPYKLSVMLAPAITRGFQSRRIYTYT